MKKIFEELLDSYIGYLLESVLLFVCGSIIGALISSLPAVLYVIFTKGINSLFKVRNILTLTPDWMETGSFYLLSIGVWIVGILWIKRRDKKLLNSITPYTKGNNIKNLFIGFIAGFILNGLCALVSILNKDIILQFSSFNIIPVLILFICVFIQSSSEELICRGYLYQKIINKYKKPIFAIIGNTLLFTVLHGFNKGVTFLSLINVFLVGIVFSLIVYYFDSLWMAMAAHTTWNFLQNIVLGLPNSGITMPYSIFKLVKAREGIAYSTSFGIEGSILVSILLIIIIMFFIYKKRENILK